MMLEVNFLRGKIVYYINQVLTDDVSLNFLFVVDDVLHREGFQHSEKIMKQ